MASLGEAVPLSQPPSAHQANTDEIIVTFGAGQVAEERKQEEKAKAESRRGKPATPTDGGPESTAERSGVRLTLWRLLREAKPERCVIIAATVCLFLSALFNLAIPFFFGRIIDAIAVPDAPTASSDLRHNIIGLLIVASLGAVFTMGRAYLFGLAGERVVARLHRKLFHAILTQEIGFFDATRTGELVSRLSSDTSVLKNTVTTNISQSLRWAATVVGGVLFLFFTSWRLTLVMTAIIPVVAWGAVYYGRYVRDLAKARRRALARATEVAEESISSIRTVRSFAREDKREEMFNTRVDTTLALGIKSALAGGLFRGGSAFGFEIAFVAIIFYGGSLVLDGHMTSGVLTSFLLYSLTIAGALAGLAALFGDFMKSVGATDRVFQILGRTPFVPNKGGVKLDHVRGDVKFEGVTFSYPTRDDQPVLQNMSLHIPAGSVVALVGPSGGGKSTVVNLVERFYDVKHGKVMLDDIPVSTLDASWLRTQIGLVRQEPSLFCASIAENIAFGVASASLTQVIEAAKRANAHDFIMGFPDQYNTLVGERGVRLSGGQKQRIAIARALLKDPRVLLLDEATSALDAESEHLVQQALDRLMVNRSTLIIAHRLSTVKNSDTVMLLDKGVVQASGPHDELMQTSPMYANLVRHQLMKQKEEAQLVEGE